MKKLLLSLINFVAAISITLFRGLVIHMFWGWFILTQFKNLPELSIMGAVGISLVVGLLCAPMKMLTAAEWEKAKNQSSEDRMNLTLISHFCWAIGCAIVLLNGYVWHLFMCWFQ